MANGLIGVFGCVSGWTAATSARLGPKVSKWTGLLMLLQMALIGSRFLWHEHILLFFQCGCCILFVPLILNLCLLWFVGNKSLEVYVLLASKLHEVLNRIKTLLRYIFGYTFLCYIKVIENVCRASLEACFLVWLGQIGRQITSHIYHCKLTSDENLR